MKNQEIDIDLAKKLFEEINSSEKFGVNLKKLLCKDCIHDGLCKFCYNTSNCKHFKNKANFADVKYGEWIKPQFVAHRGFYEVKEFKCSVCNKVYEVKQPCNLMNYCPYCGAKN